MKTILSVLVLTAFFGTAFANDCSQQIKPMVAKVLNPQGVTSIQKTGIRLKANEDAPLVNGEVFNKGPYDADVYLVRAGYMGVSYSYGFLVGPESCEVWDFYDVSGDN